MPRLLCPKSCGCSTRMQHRARAAGEWRALQQPARAAAALERAAPERHFSAMAAPRRPATEVPNPRWSAADRDSAAGASSSGRVQPGAAVAAAPGGLGLGLERAAADEAAPGALVAYQRGRRPEGGGFAPEDASGASPAPLDVGLLQRLQSNMRWVATSSQCAALGRTHTAEYQTFSSENVSGVLHGACELR